MSDDKRPRCPRCGEPARYVLAQVTAWLYLEPDGSHRRVDQVTDRSNKIETYECGGGHQWEPKKKGDTPT